MKGPLVSVIVAAYNPGKFIREAVESALFQTLKEIEVIVIDDASSEDLTQYIGEFRERIQVIRLSKNRGPAAARNAGLGVASGEYIAVLDSDDVWLPRRLEKLMDYMEAQPAVGLATTDSFLILGEQRTDLSWFATAGTSFPEENQDVHIFERNFMSGLVTYRRKLFDQYGLYDEGLRVGEDWDRNITFLTAGVRAGFLNEPLSYYRVREGSASSDEQAIARNRVAILERWERRNLRTEAKKVARLCLGRARWDVLKLEISEGRRPEFRRVLAATRAAPADVRIKALVWALLPAVSRTARAKRLEYLAGRGGAFAAAQAVFALESHDTRAAKRYLAGVVVFGYPMRIRLMAALWVGLPFARRAISRALFDDPFIKSLPRSARNEATQQQS